MKSFTFAAMAGIALGAKNDKVATEWHSIQQFWAETSSTAPSVMAKNDNLVNKIHQRDPSALTYRFEGMKVDLFKKQRFDSWFSHEMSAAPRQIQMWKHHFDDWAEKRMM